MIDKDSAYLKIAELVARFEEQYHSYKKSDYNETQTRRDFIDPFFKALGWDIDNENGYAETYREVIHEDRVKVGQGTKAPDYSFRLPGGKKLFFVEAKKPQVFIKEDIHPAYQIRRYGWSAKLPISIITDFEEFSVYDCTKRPKPTDKASVSRIKYITFRDYLSEFDFIWDTFSKERVLKGSFDRFVQSDTNKRGTATVDKEFLQSLDNWRTYLATSISWKNKELDDDEINHVVQQTIDRIIFLRIAEDRGVEPYGQLRDALKTGDYYQNLYRQFVIADDKYNSGLFNFKKDTLSSNIIVDNKVLKTIINELYYPDSPYEFSVLSVEILGSAYEQFLGKTITLDKAHRAKIEEKPEVRKAGGVYYTPQYIVDYIVQNTVGKLIEGKNPGEIKNIRIVDPACGSGSFLIGAYQYLLDYHRNFYNENGKAGKGSKDNPLTPEGNLTTAEKKKILLNNIYGVDIDVNAVEVTKLSLLLKCMEGETEASIATQLKLFNERILPTLDDNIKSGNSLIDTDFYDGQIDFEPQAEKKIKPFNWQKAFPEVFKNGGFDAVIGNPPYVQIGNQNTESAFYFTYKYIANSDLYSIFIERSFYLTKLDKNIGYIVPSLFIKGVRYGKLRTLINDNCSEFYLKEMGDGVFEKVKMPTCMIILKKGKNLINKNFFDNMALNLFKKVDVILLEQISIIRRGLEIGKDQLVDFGEFQCISGNHLTRYNQHGISFISEITYNSFRKSDEIFKSPKIIIRETGDRFNASIDLLNILNTRSIYNIKLISTKFQYNYILGIINSKLFYYYFKQFIAPETNIFPKLRIIQLRNIPIAVDYTNNFQGSISEFVDQLLQLNKEKQEVKLPSRLDQIQTRIDYCESRIDQLVYELYGLTDEEIAIIENSMNKK